MGTSTTLDLIFKSYDVLERTRSFISSKPTLGHGIPAQHVLGLKSQVLSTIVVKTTNCGHGVQIVS